MADPKRLLETLDAGTEIEMLSAAAAERPPRGARNRARLAALAVVGTAAPMVAAKASAATGGGAAKATSTLAVTALKWLAVGAVAGGVSSEITTRITTGSDEGLARSAATGSTVQAPPPATSFAGAEVPAVPEVPAPPAETEPPQPKERARGASSGSVVIGTADLELESQSLEHARFVAASNPQRGLELLDRHEARFPHGALGGEAVALRDRLRTKLAR